MKRASRQPEIVLRNGRPAAVILDIREYEELLERAEDPYDLARLRQMRAKPVRFKTIDAFAAGLRRRV